MGKGCRVLRRSFFAPTIVAATVVLSIGLAAVAAYAAVGYDEDPDPAGGVNGPTWASTLIGDELWVGGEFTSASDIGADSASRARLAVFNVNSGDLVDYSLSAGGEVRALENDGESVWIGGDFASVGGAQREGLVRWDALSRTHVPAFNASIDGDVLALKLHRGWLYVGGDFSVGDRRNLIRVDPMTGAIDNGFRADPNSRVADIAAHNDAIYIAGSFTRVGPPNNRDNEFGAAGVNWQTGAELGIEIGRISDVAQAIGVSPAGDRIYVGDDANDVIQAIVAEDDRVYVGLHDGWDFDGDDRMLVALRRSDGSNDRAFDIEMSGFWGVRELELTPQGLVAVGEFHAIRGISARRVAIFRPLGGFQPAAPLAALGDADGSGQVDLADAQAVLDTNVGKPAPDLLLRSADANSDGVISLIDALLIARQATEGQ